MSQNDRSGCSDYIAAARGCQLNGMHTALFGDADGALTIPTSTLQPQHRGWQEPVASTGAACSITLRIAFFFDGTGNNLDADEPTLKNSNVARLFRAHRIRDPGAGIYSIYIPGVATYFPEIHDPGGEDLELASGAGGDKRIDWALAQLQKIVASHPRRVLTELRICAFGFSRGAAEARAFANRVQDLCKRTAGQWQWLEAGGVPVHFYFLGLFDTVASVGLANSSSAWNSLWVAKGWSTVDEVLAKRRGGEFIFSDSGLADLAFGPPGANPTDGHIGDGHMGYGGELTVASMVGKCVQFVAMHEQRNSFPVDLVRAGNVYPSNCVEYVYPGMHSDVGGGYRPGEQARSIDNSQKLSQLPLLHMHALAIKNGVPLYGIDELPSLQYREYFDLSPKLLERWNYYMDMAGRGGKSLGQMLLSHNRLWYGWRFRRMHIHLNSLKGFSGDTMPNQAVIDKEEAKYARERAQLQAQVDATRSDPERLAANRDFVRAQQRLHAAQKKLHAYGGFSAMDAADKAKRDYDKALARKEHCNAPHNRARARLASIPGSGTAKSFQTYDLNLLKDMKMLADLVKKRGAAALRPHYRMVLDAYIKEFFKGGGLRDPEIIAFFDNYVHDSLAGFAKDVTLPCDPRTVYVGGDKKMKYAMNQPQFDQPQTSIASTDTAVPDFV